MILLMGIAGSGKGTQGKMLADTYGIHLFSMGDVLRMYLTGKQRDNILAGNLLNDKQTIEIVDKLLSTIPEKEEIIFDGFPRTIPQAKWLLEQVKKGRFELRFVLHLVATKVSVKQRLLKRGRIDDKEQSIETRFSHYESATAPIIDWFKKNGVKVYNIDAEKDIATVNKEIVSRYEKSLK